MPDETIADDETTGDSVPEPTTVYVLPPGSSVASGEPRLTMFTPLRLTMLGVVALLLAAMCSGYVFSFLLPQRQQSLAIARAYAGNKDFHTGCYLQFLQHANELQTFIAIRFFGLFAGTVLMTVGAAFVVGGLEANYSLKVTKDTASSELVTSSSGLVIATLGLALCLASVLHDTTLTFAAVPTCL